MSTIEPNIQGAVIPPHIGRRILEIMEEKGRAFTQQALAIRIGMNKQTLSKKLRGERDLYMFELRRIADALHLTVERIMQDDTHDEEKRLQILFMEMESPNAAATKIISNTHIALDICKKMASIAIGVSEKCKVFNDLGRAYYFHQAYDEAHTAWLNAVELARRLVEKYNSTDLYHKILENLLISSTLISGTTDTKKILEEIEDVFSTNPNRLGIVYYAYAKIAENNNDLELSREHACKSLDFFMETQNLFSIAKARVTVAHYEYKLENYIQAKEHLEEARSALESHTYFWLLTTKDYVKCLMKLNMKELAEGLLTEVVQSVDSLDPKILNVKGKLLILLSLCRETESHAESVLNDPRINESIRMLAMRFLKNHCIRMNDKDNLMKYAILENELVGQKNNLLDEEVL